MLFLIINELRQNGSRQVQTISASENLPYSYHQDPNKRWMLSELVEDG